MVAIHTCDGREPMELARLHVRAASCGSSLKDWYKHITKRATLVPAQYGHSSISRDGRHDRAPGTVEQTRPPTTQK